MSRYSIGFTQATAPSTLAPWAVLRAPAGGRVLRVRQIQVVTAAATVAQVGIAWAGATVTPVVSSSQSPPPRDPRDVAATALLDVAWGTAPQLPSVPVYLKEALIGGVQGNGATFPFDEPLGPSLLINVDYDE
jgi:hypothetical protein